MKQGLSISSLALLGIIAAISPVSAVEAGAGLTDLGSKTSATTRRLQGDG
ncbi:MAG: hypothetical protein QXK38_03625 [Candidatus Caldarchaeum sp.]